MIACQQRHTSKGRHRQSPVPAFRVEIPELDDAQIKALAQVLVTMLEQVEKDQADKQTTLLESDHGAARDSCPKALR